MFWDVGPNHRHYFSKQKIQKIIEILKRALRLCSGEWGTSVIHGSLALEKDLQKYKNMLLLEHSRVMITCASSTVVLRAFRSHCKILWFLSCCIWKCLGDHAVKLIGLVTNKAYTLTPVLSLHS